MKMLNRFVKTIPYIEEELPDEYIYGGAVDGYGNPDNGTMPENVGELREAVVGRRIVKAEKVVGTGRPEWYSSLPWSASGPRLEITLDDGKKVTLADTDDCCAYTNLSDFLLDPESVDHVIMGVGTTEKYTRWHIYADHGDVMQLEVGWSAGNPFYYGYGFHIDVVEDES